MPAQKTLAGLTPPRDFAQKPLGTIPQHRWLAQPIPRDRLFNFGQLALLPTPPPHGACYTPLMCLVHDGACVACGTAARLLPSASKPLALPWLPFWRNRGFRLLGVRQAARSVLRANNHLAVSLACIAPSRVAITPGAHCRANGFDPFGRPLLLRGSRHLRCLLGARGSHNLARA